MAAPMTQAVYVAAVLNAATARGVADPDAITSIRREAIDTFQSYLNTASGRPIGNLIDDRGH